MVTAAPSGIELHVNGEVHRVDVPPDVPLLWVIREELGLTGTKFGCGAALCGACTVHVNGEPRRSCMTPVGTVAGAAIVTIEGLAKTELAAVQEAWIEESVPQCGYCQAGQILSTAALLRARPAPTDEDIDAVLSASLCRCGTYLRIRRAVHKAAEKLAARGGPSAAAPPADASRGAAPTSSRPDGGAEGGT